MEYEVSKIGAAVEQLDCAIRQFFDHQYVCAITLAGAAESLLGIPLSDQSVNSLLKKSLHKQSGVDPREISDEHLNRARNWLKHGGKSADEVIYLELEEEALQIILRAVTNMLTHDNSVPSEAPRFFEWLSKNRPELFATSNTP